MNNVVDIQRGLEKLEKEREELRAFERGLKPYNTDNMSYDPLRIVNEIKFFANQLVGSGYQIANRLILLNKHEDATTLSHLLTTHLDGVHLRTVQRFNRFARYAAHWPKFRTVFGEPKMMNKGLALLMNLTDPEIEAELDELEKSGEIAGLKEIELQGMSVKALQKEVKKLRALRDKKYEALEKENDRLNAEVETLGAAALAPGLEKAQKLLKAGKAKLTEALSSLAQADFGLLRGDAGSVAVIRLTIDEGRLILDELEKQAFPGGVRQA